MLNLLYLYNAVCNAKTSQVTKKRFYPTRKMSSNSNARNVSSNENACYPTLKPVIRYGILFIQYDNMSSNANNV